MLLIVYECFQVPTTYQYHTGILFEFLKCFTLSPLCHPIQPSYLFLSVRVCICPCCRCCTETSPRTSATSPSTSSVRSSSRCWWQPTSPLVVSTCPTSTWSSSTALPATPVREGVNASCFLVRCFSSHPLSSPLYLFFSLPPPF